MGTDISPVYRGGHQGSRSEMTPQDHTASVGRGAVIKCCPKGTHSYLGDTSHKKITRGASKELRHFLFLCASLSKNLTCLTGRAASGMEGEALIQAVPLPGLQVTLRYLRCQQLCHLNHMTGQRYGAEGFSGGERCPVGLVASSHGTLTMRPFSSPARSCPLQQRTIHQRAKQNKLPRDSKWPCSQNFPA